MRHDPMMRLTPRGLYLLTLATVFGIGLVGLPIAPTILVYGMAAVGLLAGAGAIAETLVHWWLVRWAHKHCRFCPDGIPSPTWHPNGQLGHVQPNAPNRIIRP